MIPRLMISAPTSGAGKTTVTCALLQALQDRGLRVTAYKTGPDYIDPMFHSRVIGAESRNLDGFFFDKGTIRTLLGKNSRNCDISLMEGAMGFYDGIGLSSDGSAWEMACTTDTPVLLVVDGKGAAISVAATVRGFLQFRQNSHIVGVILNRVSAGLYPGLAKVIGRETGLPVLGYLPVLPECAIESRHLGLLTADEVSDLQDKVKKLAETAAKTMDLDGIINLSRSASDFDWDICLAEPLSSRKIRVGIAMDRAFCFYYADALDLLQQLGAELVPFSPLNDHALPKDICGIYLGGGYPELYARQLSGNSAMLKELRCAIQQGMPTIAECGGFLYLHQSLEAEDGAVLPMVGLIEGKAFRTPRLGRFGYITMTARKDGLLCRKGDAFPAHEFHYWDSTAPGRDFRADKPLSDRGWETAVMEEHLYAGFPHMHLCAKPQMAIRYLTACMAYRSKENA